MRTTMHNKVPRRVALLFTRKHLPFQY